MNAPAQFKLPSHLVATNTPEARGLARDEVRLLVSGPDGHRHATFTQLADFLAPGTLLVVNRSATLPASLPARTAGLDFVVNLSTRYAPNLWLVEPRWSAALPGTLPLSPGDRIEVASLPAQFVAPYPGLPRLWFLRIDGDVDRAMREHGEPIRYAYLEPPYPQLDAYQTIFAKNSGSAEMPSAARPFTQRVLDALAAREIAIAEIELHTGVSSLEIESDDQPLYAEPFVVPPETAEAVNDARNAGSAVIAVGTTVVRALESAFDESGVRPTAGFTRAYVRPGNPVRSIDGMITGLHEPKASHLAMLNAVAGTQLVSEAYAVAMRHGYLWHEFGDSHLLLPKE